MRSSSAIATTLGLLLIFAIPARGYAEQPVYASDRAESSRELSRQATECLRRGEEAPANDARLAAYREGLELARRAVAADDTNADAHYNVFACDGRIQMIEGVVPNPVNLMRVNRELDRALELNPNHADALAARGGLYRQLPWVLGGNLDKAEEYLSRSLKLDPDSPTVLIELAQTYRDKGQPARAVPLLQQAVTLAERMKRERQLTLARQLLQETQQTR